MDETTAAELDTDENEVSPVEPSLSPEDRELFHQMMEAGVFYGRSKSKTNPLMKKYVAMTRSGFEVIDLEKTILKLKEAAVMLKERVASGDTVLFVGTSPAVKQKVEKTAKKLGMPYVTERWLGGTLTNFDTIAKRISHFKKLKDDKAKGRLEKYTKKEQLSIDRELAKLTRLFSGIEGMDGLPDVLFIADITENEYAAKEARQIGIPVVSMLNTDANPELADYGIPANDRSLESAELVIGYLEEAMSGDKGVVSARQEADSGSGEELSLKLPEAGEEDKTE